MWIPLTSATIPCMGDEQHTNKTQSPADVWMSHSLFESVPKEVLTQLLSEMTKVSVPAGEEIIRQGDKSRDMILLSEGTVKVTVVSPDGSEIVDKQVDSPAILGEMSLVTREPRSATVKTVTPIQGLSLNPIGFLTLLSEHPEVAGFLTTLVGKKLKEGAGIRKVGKYRILRQLGSGAAATVFEAEHPDLGTTVAVKMLSHALVAHVGFSGHFAKEGKTAAKLDHPNIVRILDTERAYGTLFIVMERLHGTVLSELISKGKPLPSRKVRIILMDCCRALAHTHKAGLVHRDIKPSNLFMSQDGVAKLLDFGIAADISETGMSSERVGTPYYMSPEQIRGQSLDGRADIYSLGVMAFQLLTGTLPFQAPELKDLLKKHLHTPIPLDRLRQMNLPPDLTRFIEVATCKKKEHRYASCSEALAELTSGRELPFVHTLIVGNISIIFPAEARDIVHVGLKGVRGLLDTYGIRCAETTISLPDGEAVVIAVTAHPSHRRRVERSFTVLEDMLVAKGVHAEFRKVWSPEEQEEGDKLAFPADILTTK